MRNRGRLTPQQALARVKSKDTSPELCLRRLLHALGYRYRIHVSALPGTPDVVFAARRKAIFVHGCFWHRHNCGHAYTPRTNQEFWVKKFAQNRRRDERVMRDLERLGWQVEVVWSCELKEQAALKRRLVKFLGPTRSQRETGASRR